MPIEIRELVIRAVAVDSAESPPATDRLGRPETISAEEHRRIVEQCVRQVLEVLRRQEER